MSCAWVAAVFLLGSAAIATADNTVDLYRSVAIVTGRGEANRAIGFRECLRKVLVRVSGDQRVLQSPGFGKVEQEAGRFVESFSYRDRMEGVPIHDEQGSYDRPHDLTCLYKPSALDQALRRLDSRPWLSHRPTLAVFLTVERGSSTFRLSRENEDGAAMRESFGLAAAPMAMRVVFPDQAAAASPDDAGGQTGGDQAGLEDGARIAGGEVALTGRITWSDADYGWIAQWRLAYGGADHRWGIRGVNFDEAFRVAIRGSAQILSGNGTPQ